jgi:hypothetical protein
LMTPQCSTPASRNHFPPRSASLLWQITTSSLGSTSLRLTIASAPSSSHSTAPSLTLTQALNTSSSSATAAMTPGSSVLSMPLSM